MIEIMSIAVVAILAAVGVLLWLSRRGARLPMPYRERGCQGDGWRRSFPAASKQDIRGFLSLFVEAFEFKAADGLRFGPDDRVLDVYRALYPSVWAPDSMELEVFAKSLRETYHIDPGANWGSSLTLGELFSQAQAGRQAGQQAGRTAP